VLRLLRRHFAWLSVPPSAATLMHTHAALRSGGASWGVGILEHGAVTACALCRTCLTVHARAGLRVDVDAIKRDFLSLLPMLDGEVPDGCLDVTCRVRAHCRSWPTAL
jgi:hypothetical protein